MDGFHSQPVNRYYKVLELNRDASPGKIRAAYKKLAMKWHPAKCVFKALAEPKLRFQEIQEAYAVLSDQKKKALYDCGLYDPGDDDEDVEGFTSFLDEMASMMGRVQASQDPGAGNSMEDLQKLFISMFSADLATLSNPEPPISTINVDQKGSWGNSKVDPFYFGSYSMGKSFSSSYASKKTKWAVDRLSLNS